MNFAEGGDDDVGMGIPGWLRGPISQTRIISMMAFRRHRCAGVLLLLLENRSVRVRPAMNGGEHSGRMVCADLGTSG